MALVLQGLDASGNLIVDFNDDAGTNNEGIRTNVRDISAGEIPQNLVTFSGTYHGGTKVRQRAGLRMWSWSTMVRNGGSADGIRAFANKINRYLEGGGDGRYLKFQASSSSEVLYIDFLGSEALSGLLRGQELAVLKSFVQFHDPEGIPIVILAQPYLRGAELDSDTNKLKNPFLLFDTNGNGRPDEWTWDSTTNITAEEINAPNEAYSFAIATASARNLEQQTAAGTFAVGDICTFSFYAKGAGAKARAVVRFQDSAGTPLGTEQAGTLTTLTSAEQRISVTTSAAPASTSRAKVTIRFENADATSYTVYLRRVQFEEASSASSFVGSTEIVPNDPAGQTVHGPTTAMTALATSGGSVTAGSHGWYATFVTADGETTVGPKVVITVGAPPNQTVPLSNIPLGSSEVIARKIYRTVAGDTGNPKLVTTINDNTTTTFNDTIADGSLGADAPTSNTTAEKASRVHLVYNAGDADAPFIFEAKGDSGAQVQAIGYATLSALEDGGKSLSRWLNGPRIIQCEDFNVTGDFGAGGVVVGVDTADGDASGGRAVVYSSFNQTDYRQLLRIELTDTDALEGYRGASDVRLRLEVSAASDLEFQMRWADSMEEPASIRALPVRHNTNIDGLATFGYVEMTLGRIALPTEGTLEGLTIEIWARRKAGGTPNLSLDCLVLVPTEKASLISLPYTARALVAENTANATLGNKLGTLKWRVTFRYSAQGVSATYEAGFRIRRDSTSGTILHQREVAHANDITNATVAMEFTSLSGVSYFTTTDTAAGTGTLTIHEVIVEKVCILENGQTLVTDPRLGIDRAYQLSSTGAIMCSAVGAPIPFWLPPGLTAVYIEVMEPRIGGQYAELASNLRRLTTLSHRYAPRYPA